MKWPSWLNFVLGIWLVVAPWALFYRSAAATWEDVVLGTAVLIVALASARVSSANTSPAWVNAILGVWLIIAPWVFGYAVLRQAVANDVIVGIAVLVLALVRIGTARTLAAGELPPPRA